MSDFQAQLEAAINKVDLWNGRVHDALGKAMIEGAIIIQGEAKKNVASQTHGTGHLAQSITVGKLESSGPVLSIEVGVPEGDTATYARVVEYGSSPHVKSEGSEEFVASVTRWGELNGLTQKEIDAVIFFIRKNGTKPKPYLGPAYYGNIREIQENIAHAVGEV